MAAHDARNKAEPKDHLVSQGQSVLIENAKDDDSLHDRAMRKQSLIFSRLGSDIMVS
jgi:hypothetical protein